MRVAVLLPTLQEAGQIGEVLDHLQALPGDWRIVVADGGSRDGTPDLARAHPRADEVLTATGGRAAQCNAAGAAALQDPEVGVLLVLHADSRLPSTAHASLRAAATDPAVAGGAFRLLFDGGDRFSAMLTRVYAAQQRMGFWYGDCSCWVTREAWDQLGGFRELPIMDDHDLVRRMQALPGRRAVVLPGPATTSARRWQRSGLARTLVTWWLIRWAYLGGAPPHLLARLYRVVR